MKQKSAPIAKAAPSRLQRELSAGILELIRAEKLAPGTRLAEVALAERLQVSRTPVRAALKLLAGRRLIRVGASRGYFVTDTAPPAPKTPGKPAPADTDRLFVAIARDRRSGRLPVDVSERDLMQRYGASRPVVQRVLAKLAEVAAVQRKPGHGWRFQPIIADAKARAESYRYRILIEPAALLEPGFQLDPVWAAEMRRRHQDATRRTWNETASIAFFEMNAAFHEGLAAASGNRFLLVAVQQQNRLRSFANYDWTFGYERVLVNCREHLAILDRLEAGEREAAAALMRSHLEGASRVKRVTDEAANGRRTNNGK
ncbi:GntR family transcriptional regulator [Bradyrhizobium septentrionale]|uniref:GntR family transcriptional regulator n=1 Tax=Bradyrhizobium septentrionale TaxID=1404411 RepID=A0A974A022_9BRAD|nr:GntR family transcriptional regulator [Bradyrhizobium septentrionale]UGY13629.1 GntR family transcriptional regulator [Bradyrhizobium septentrionale]UGY22267.1 GntR family transcriptional regulator [Bradyrhizobium septentrionale]